MIKVLDKHVAELIAAGEVIERPASIVKELIENSIDAGATQVVVEIAAGGATYMRVTDNGRGIPAGEVKTAFLRHATSKISGESDLANINTLGFRGEALASVCAVSRVEIITKTPKAVTGVKYTVTGGEEGEVAEAGTSSGTTIIVRDLFYNVPARLKFLRKDGAESAAVTAVIEAAALSHPEVSFKYIRDNKVILHTAGDGLLKSAIYSIRDSVFTENLIAVDYNHENIKVSGFVSKPENSLPSRSMQRFFVNGRPVKSGILIKALEEAYTGTIMRGKFPACVLEIILDPGAVDVNVHPAKTEVRFSQDKNVYSSVYFAVKSTLQQLNENKITAETKTYNDQSDFKELEGTQENLTLFSSVENLHQNELRTEDAIYPIKKGQELRFDNNEPERDSKKFKHIDETSIKSPLLPSSRIIREESDAISDGQQLLDASNSNPLPSGETSPLLQESAPITQEIKIVGEMFKTYIVGQLADTMFIIDKHAAHERILYNDLSKPGGFYNQTLLTPISVQLTPVEFQLVMENIGVFGEFGFVFNEFGNNTVVIREVPTVLDSLDIANIFKEIAANMVDLKQDPSPEVLREIYCMKACKAAIKANDNNSMQELTALAKRVIEDSEIRYCPHGRPVLLTVTKDKLAGMMGR